MNIFFSYAHEDSEKVKAIADRLEKYHDCWIDWDDIQGGQLWSSEIRKGIYGCQRFLFFVSESSLRSDWCAKELRLALWLQKPIIPVVFSEGVQIPKPLASRQWVVFTDLNSGVEKILASLSQGTGLPWRAIALVEFCAIALVIFLSVA